jgi:hypothetical protein
MSKTFRTIYPLGRVDVYQAAYLSEMDKFEYGMAYARAIWVPNHVPNIPKTDHNIWWI